VCPREVLDGCGKSRLDRDSIPDRLSLYRLRDSGPLHIKILLQDIVNVIFICWPTFAAAVGFKLRRKVHCCGSTEVCGKEEDINCDYGALHLFVHLFVICLTKPFVACVTVYHER
jgi:hypothetical protein